MTRVDDDMQPAPDDLQATQDDLQPAEGGTTQGRVIQGSVIQDSTYEDSADRDSADGRLTTEQIAHAADDRTDETPPSPERSTADAHAQLLADNEKQDVIGRWREIQAAFVDEPRKAVTDADALVADLMQRLAQMFATEREQLEVQWSAGRDVSTEDLRQGLQRYRSFFERLLAA
ncbi:MAG TPA: hypothetical protein VGH27_00435 [Streptosporangiaceae bacterium]|jgi:hypothetical protein